MPRRKAAVIPDDLLDQLLAGGDAATALNSGGLLDALKKALAERALNAEMNYHLNDADEASNTRNGYGRKTVTTSTVKVEIKVPHDRAGTFDPQLIARYQRRFPGFDDKIISMYARGMSTREIDGHLREIYGMDASADLISTITDAVLDEVAVWQQRTLDAIYPLVIFDAIRVKIRDEGLVRNKAIHIALGVMADGTKVVLGMWIEQNEGAKFWPRVMNELKNRSIEDILLAVVDGLKGFPEAITAVFPEAVVQTCWCGRPPNGITMCQVEVVANLKEETIRGTSYPSWHRHVKARLPASWRQRRREAHPAQKAAAYRDDGVFEKLPPTVIAIEACGASHHLARLLTSYGHEVKLIAPQLVKPYVKRGKNDAADVEALCEAMSRPTMRFVPIKTSEQQAALMLVGIRDRLIRTRTQLSTRSVVMLQSLG